MSGNVEQQTRQIHCASCGRNFRWAPELAGRTMKCPCGTALRVPAVVSCGGADDDFGEYDVAEPPPAPAPPAAAAVGLTAPAGSADAPHAAPGAPITIHLPPQRKRLRPEPRVDPETLDKPSTLRDWVVPSILIAIGVTLRFVEVTAASESPIHSAGPALATVVMKLVLSVGLMLAGMFLAVQLLEVCFIGALPRTAYKLVAIAVAPGALYGILTHVGGPVYGSILGTFASVVAFGLLFWLLMRLDLKDSGICVLMTWILITAANYAAYRAEGMIRDSWI
jgi:hypothetical protein